MGLQVVPKFSVIDETEDWVMVDKPAPLIVHPSNDKPEPTLLGGLQRLFSYEIENGACLGIVTRLDRETSGVVLVAKHTAAARDLGGVFERREAVKRYLAIVIGWPDDDEWVCDAKITRGGEVGATDIWVRQVVSEEGKACQTRFSVENRFLLEGRQYSLVRCFPKSGRMHQIRVHLAANGHPIVGDKIYSGTGQEYLEWMETGWTPGLKGRLLLPRHALHASGLGFPWEGQEIFGEAPLPDDMVGFMDGRDVGFADEVVMWSRTD